MNMRAILVVMLAIICGVSAAVGTNRLRTVNSEAKIQNPETVAVVVAKVDIPMGVTVDESLVQTCQWPKDHVPPGAILTLEDATQRATTVRILAGEPLHGGKLAAKGSGSGLAAIIPKGMRAYTIQSAQVAANVAGFILPGNRVDVLLNLRGRGVDDETGGGSTTTLLQAVEILAVDQRLDVPTENKVDLKDLRSITLLVTPEQANLLALGQSAGTLSVSLAALGRLGKRRNHTRHTSRFLASARRAS